MASAVEQVLTSESVIDDGDMRLRRVLPHADATTLGPFVFIDHYRHRTPRGIGDRPHPHAGIDVVSYLLEGGVEHRDSMGHRDRIGAGDAQVIRAGKGMLHAEQPLAGRHGLQLWMLPPAALRNDDPTYASFRHVDIPRVTGEGTTLHVLSGKVNDVDGPLALRCDAVFARLQLAPDAAATVTYPDGLELAVYVLAGRVDIGARPVPAGGLARLSAGTSVRIAGRGADAIELVLLGGRRHEGQVHFSGPFAMDSPEQLARARRDAASGRMGRLDGVPF